MEDTTPNNANWNDNSNLNQNFNQNQFLQNVPKSNGSFVIGIIALCVTTVCCFCYGSFAGFILSVIGLILGRSAKNTYQENPGAYNPASYKKAKTGVVLNMIALIISIIVSTLLIIAIYMGLNGQLPDEYQDKFDESMSKYQN